MKLQFSVNLWLNFIQQKIGSHAEKTELSRESTCLIYCCFAVTNIEEIKSNLIESLLMCERDDDDVRSEVGLVSNDFSCDQIVNEKFYFLLFPIN